MLQITFMGEMDLYVAIQGCHLLVCFAHCTSRCDRIGCPGELAYKLRPNVQTTFSTHPSEVVELAPVCEEVVSRTVTPVGTRVHHIRGACSGGGMVGAINDIHICNKNSALVYGNSLKPFLNNAS